MTEDSFGVVYVRRGIDQTQPFEVGDPLTGYELGEPMVWKGLPPHSGRHAEDDKYVAAVTKYANKSEHWAVRDELYCTCISRRTVAHVVVHLPTERPWLRMKPEKVPNRFRDLDAGFGNGSYPLHGLPGEAPHINGVSSCAGCRARWLVVSYPDRGQLLRIKRPIYGASISS